MGWELQGRLTCALESPQSKYGKERACLRVRKLEKHLLWTVSCV